MICSGAEPFFLPGGPQGVLLVHGFTGIPADMLLLGHSLALIKDGEIYRENMHVSPCDQGNQFNHAPLRRRKLLLYKAEIVKLFSQTREKGWTLVPLKIYFKHGRAKLELALASGKHNYDKRQDPRKKSRPARHPARAQGTPALIPCLFFRKR